MVNFSRLVVYNAIDQERAYQDKKWGGESHDRQHSLGQWINFMEDHLIMARDLAGVDDMICRDELRKVIALGVACLESMGCTQRK